MTSDANPTPVPAPASRLRAAARDAEGLLVVFDCLVRAILHADPDKEPDVLARLKREASAYHESLHESNLP